MTWTLDFLRLRRWPPGARSHREGRWLRPCPHHLL